MGLRLLIGVLLVVVYFMVRREMAARKAAGDAIQQSEERFRRLSEAAFEGIVIHDEGKILEVNQTMAHMLGYGPDELIGMTASQVTAPESHEIVARNIASGNEKPYEATGLRKNGSMFPIEVRGAAIPYKGRTVRVTAIRDITERKQAEEALHESEERNRTLLAALPQRVFFKDLQSVFVSVNELFAQDIGMTPEEVVGKSDYDLHHKEFADQYRADEMRIMQTRQPEAREQVNMLLGGRNCSIEVVKAPVIRDNGKVIGILGLYSDISARKRTEEALRESEERYSSVIAALEEGVVLQNADGSISAINASAEHVLGLTASQMLGLKSFYTKWLSIHEDGTPFPEDQYPAQVTLRTGQPCSNVVMGIHKPDGSLAWLSVNSQPLIKSGDSKPHAVVSSFTDITERKQAERALFELTIRDGLTGLYNRREMDRLLDEEVKRYQRHDTQVSLVMLDIDHFKQVNDNYGHQVGDEVLRWAARLVRQNVRDIDRAARYGGEEFALILPGAEEEQALVLAERIRRAVSARAFRLRQEDGRSLRIPVTISLGVAGLSPAISTAEDLMAAADEAMYQAKHAGRNRVQCASLGREEGLLISKA